MKTFITLITALLFPTLAPYAAEPITNSIGMTLVRIEPGTFKMA